MAPIEPYAAFSRVLRLLPPGSGKTYVANRILKRHPFPAGPLVSCRLRNGSLMNLNLTVEQEARTYLVGDWEPATVAFILSQRPRVVFDVGANIGLVAIPLAQKLPDCRVYAFEPHPANTLRLHENIELNGVSNVEVVPAAVSSFQGTLAMAESSPMMHNVRSTGKLRVPCIALDAFIGSGDFPVDIVKIDVEGHELEVLRGAKFLLRTQRPVVVCEVNNGLLKRMGTSAAEMRLFLSRLGYRECGLPPVGLQRLRRGRPRDNRVFNPPIASCRTS
jgi:FkbM family methyltransferase